MSESTYLNAFNSQIDEFIKDIRIVLADYYEVLLACTVIVGLKALSSTMIINVWYERVTLVYMDKINAKDYQFFLEKDYIEDLKDNSYAAQINTGINKIRNRLRELDEEDKAKVLKYVENLCHLSKLYFKELESIL